MSQTTVVDRTRFDNGKEPYHEPTTTPADISLLDLLHNPIILDNIVPYLRPSTVLNIAATSRDLHDFIHNTPGAFRYLDLSSVKHAGEEVLYEALIDPFQHPISARPLRTISVTLRDQNILGHVQTLILDGLTVAADYVNDILVDPTLNVRILSIREVRDLRQEHLRRVLQHACRSDRPQGMPKLKALYVFGYKDEATFASDRALERPHGWTLEMEKTMKEAAMRRKDEWWSRKGTMVRRFWDDEWATCLQACEGIIAFDTVLCRGPRHRNSPAFGTVRVSEADAQPALATIALPGCVGCGKSPEGLFHPTDNLMAATVPLLGPPITSSSLRAAKIPNQPASPFVPRCADCVEERYCSSCHKWWCEACYTPPGRQPATASIVVVDDDDTSVTAEDFQLKTASAKPKVRSSFCPKCEEEDAAERLRPFKATYGLSEDDQRLMAAVATLQSR